MKSLKWMGLLSLVVVAGMHGRSYAEEATTDTVSEQKETPLYLVGEYDPQRDPSKDLAKALKLAQKEGKNVILQVGGDWCGWCRRMTDYFHGHQAIRDMLSKNFVIMKVNFSNDNKNERFLSDYPKVPAFPHLFVLDGNGKLLCSQFTGDLEEGSSYNEKAVLDFLGNWTPSAVAKASPVKSDESEAQ